MIFDVKLGENCRLKARLVAGGQETGEKASIREDIDGFKSLGQSLSNCCSIE